MVEHVVVRDSASAAAMIAGISAPTTEALQLKESKPEVASGQEQPQGKDQPQPPIITLLSSAEYPLPEPLAKRLHWCVQQQHRHSHMHVHVEAFEDALAALVQNSIEALDRMYFATPSLVRKRPEFQHRLCLRVRTNSALRTLSITDFGCGMTRADLINGLGIGGIGGMGNGNGDRSSPSYSNHQTLEMETTDEDAVGDDDDDRVVDPTPSGGSSRASSSSRSSATETGSTNDNDSDCIVPEEEQEKAAKDKSLSPRMLRNHGHDIESNFPTNSESSSSMAQHCSCTSADVGGFYAALCSLGTGVLVETKALYDEFYEFQVGSTESSSSQEAMLGDEKNPICNLSSFTVRCPSQQQRPSEEELDADAAFDNVRSSGAGVVSVCSPSSSSSSSSSSLLSGTRVTIWLNDRAIAAHLLDEQSVLKPIFVRLLQKTHYTVAFSSDQDTVHALINARAMEMKAQQLSSKDEDPLDDAVAGMDLIGSSISSSSSSMKIDREEEEEDIYNSVRERAKYIPLRLNLRERKMLRLVEAVMACSDYTTKVDHKAFKNSVRRTHALLQGITSILRGLITAIAVGGDNNHYDHNHNHYYNNRNNTADEEENSHHQNNLSPYESFFQQTFEIARRHKIMNPEKMRTEYGTLVHVLQDAVAPTVKPHLLDFSVKGPIASVYSFLDARGGLALLSDALIETATAEILAGKKPRTQIDQEIRLKERAVVALKRKYRSHRLSEEDIHLCLYSICDNNSFINSNRVPIDKIIDYLLSHFSATHAEVGYSLSIVSGEDGARLSHSHERQFYYALQSLTLWRDIVGDMFRLWAMAEEDLLSETITYRLQDTGQGMQRVQQSPRTYRAMQRILQRVQQKLSHWVGSSVIHMGDHNVPNALSFIDKYTQVPRILGPIVACLENLERIYDQDSGIQAMIDSGYGGLDTLRKDILFDFFRSAFDGSGADNFYDAGSCIDGRLTSAWNWCSQLPTKSFYPIFKLTGFSGFDGEFK